MKPISTILTVLTAALCISCGKKENPNQVVLYTSLDRPHSEPIIKLFEERTGIEVKAVYDAEAAKTVGLVNRLIAEKKNPQADVFWNSEVLRTFVLKDKDILTPYQSPNASAIPELMKDSESYWTGFAARARVLLYNTELVSTPPKTLEELTQPDWKGKVAIANPLFGTTNTQLAHWWTHWGEQETQNYLSALKANDVVISPGNAMAKDMVARGEIPICLTDTDDAWSAVVNGHPVKLQFPDQENGKGTLFIPNTVAKIKDGPNSENANKLIDFLLSPEVEAILSKSESAQIPLRSVENIPEHVQEFSTLVITPNNFEKSAAEVIEASTYVKNHFQAE